MKALEFILSHFGLVGIALYIAVISTNQYWIGTKWGDVYMFFLALMATIGIAVTFDAIGKFLLK